MHTHSNWWTATRLINWDTTMNVRRFLDWHSIRGKIGNPLSYRVGKQLGVPLGLNMFKTGGIILGLCNIFLLGFAPEKLRTKKVC